MALSPDLDDPEFKPQKPRRKPKTLVLERPVEMRTPPRTSRLRYDADGNDIRTAQASDDALSEDKEKRRRVLLEEALERFKIVAEIEYPQREREDEDLRFDRAEPEDHWPDEIARGRRGDASTGAQARPMLTIPKLDQPVQSIINEGQAANLGIIIEAKGDGSADDDAEVRQGMIRSIQTDSRASIARNWAYDRTVKCGRGYYRILTTYANDDDFDLDIVISRIKNQGSVYLDPFASEPDWSDGEWAFIVQDFPRNEVPRRFGKGLKALDLSHIESVDMDSPTDPGGLWCTRETVRVAEYFYVVYETRWLVLVNPETGETQLLEKGQKPEPGQRAREVEKRVVKWCLITAHDIIKEEDWQGRYIPIIPVIGKEYNVGGKASWKGVVSNAKDAQRSYNYFRSAQVETVALAKSAPWVMAEGQDEGFEEEWDDVNVANRTRIHYKPTTFEGHLVPAPQRDVAEPAIQAMTLLTTQADDDIKATTFRGSASLGNIDPRARSGKAIRELKQQGELGSSNYLRNLAEISMTLEGLVILDLLPKVYDRAGRIVKLLGDDPDDTRYVMLNEWFTPDDDGRPIRTQLEAPMAPGMAPPGGPPALPPAMAGPGGPPPGAPPMAAGPGMMPPGGLPPGGPMAMPGMDAEEPPQPKKYDLSKGKFSVVVSVGPNTQTQKEANAQMVEALMQAVPQAAPMVADLWAENLSGPMAKKMAERFREMNPALQKDKGQLPPAVQAQLQQMQQTIQQLQQTLATDKVKTDAEIQIAQMKLAAERELAVLKLQTEREIAQIRAAADLQKTDRTNESREAIAVRENAADRAEQLAKQRHELEMQEREVAIDEQTAAREVMVADHEARRDEAAETRAVQRETLVGDHQATRDETIASRSSARDEAAATRAASREATLSDRAAERDARLAAAKPKTPAKRARKRST